MAKVSRGWINQNVQNPRELDTKFEIMPSFKTYNLYYNDVFENLPLTI